MPVANTAKDYRLGTTPVQRVYAGAVQVWPQVPVLTDISPDNMLHLSGAITLTATGSNFRTGCILQIKLTTASSWTNINASTVVSPTQMTGSVDMVPGNYTVRVVDAQGRASVELPFQGQNNTPTLSSISPTSMFYEDAPQRLTVTGSSFYGAVGTSTGLHLFLLPPGGSWQDKGLMTISSGTSAYVDGIDPSSTGTWQVMLGYDNPNTTRSGQLPLTVANATPVLASADGWVDQWMGGTVYLHGSNFAAPMSLGLGDNGGWCFNDPNYWYDNVIVDSPTEAHRDFPTSDAHGSNVTVDSWHDVRIKTSAGTSNWLADQNVAFT